METRKGFVLGIVIILGVVFLSAFIGISSIWKDNQNSDNQISDNQIAKILKENPERNVAHYDDYVDRQNEELLNEEKWGGKFENELTQKLMSVGDPAVEPLIQALEHENWKVRRTAAVALGRMKSEKAVEPLIKILKEDDAKLVVMAAAVALGEIGDERAIEPLLDVLTERKDYNVTPHLWTDDLEPYYTTVPCRAAEVLIKMGLDERAIEPFILSLNYIDTQEIAIFALGKIGDEGVIEPLFEVFKSPIYTGGSEIICMRSNQTSKSIVNISKRVGEPAIDILIKGLEDEDVLVRKGAANTLGMLGPDAKKAVPALMEVAKTDYENFGASFSYVNYVVTYGSFGGASYHNINGGGEFNPYNCKNQYKGAGPEAVEALLNIGDEKAIKSISQTLRNENRNREIQKQIVSAIRKTNNSNAIEILHVALGTEHSVVKNAAIYALEDIGGKEAIEVLTYASYDKDSDIRENAIRALEKLQEAK